MRKFTDKMAHFIRRPINPWVGVVMVGLVIAGAFYQSVCGCSSPEQVSRNNTMILMDSIRAALDTFHERNGRYPTQAEGLSTLVAQDAATPNSELLESLPKDSWDADYIYRNPSSRGGAYEIISMGPDGKLDTEDDLFRIGSAIN